MLDLLLVAPVVPLHLGALHPFEKVLTLVLAVGPFLLLGLVVWLRKRSDAALDEEPADDEHALDG